MSEFKHGVSKGERDCQKGKSQKVALTAEEWLSSETRTSLDDVSVAVQANVHMFGCRTRASTPSSIETTWGAGISTGTIAVPLTQEALSFQHPFSHRSNRNIMNRNDSQGIYSNAKIT